MAKDNLEEKIEALDKRLAAMEENIAFLKQLLSHLHSQFQEFKKDTDKRV